MYQPVHIIMGRIEFDKIAKDTGGRCFVGLLCQQSELYEALKRYQILQLHSTMAILCIQVHMYVYILHTRMLNYVYCN